MVNESPLPPEPPTDPGPAIVPPPAHGAQAAPLPPLPRTSAPPPPVPPRPLPPPLAPAGPSGSPPTDEPRLLRLAIGFYAIVTVFSVGYALFSGGLGTLFGDSFPSAGNVLASVLVAAGVVGMCHLGDRLFPQVRRAGDALIGLLGPVSVSGALLLSALAGFAEELLFRGALWPALGLWGTSLLFGLVHTLPRRALALYPVFAAVVGLLLGLLRSGSGSVLPAMLAHAGIDAANLLWLSRRLVAASAPRPS